MAVSTSDVLSVLKPKVASLGLNKKEVEGVAQKIVETLSISDSATDEEKQAGISSAIESALPYLSFAQAIATRVINEKKEKDTPKESNPPAPKDLEPKEDQAVLDLRKQLEAMQASLASLTAEKQTDNRRKQLEETLKDTGIFKDTTLKQFARMTFKDNEDFEAYLSDVKNDAKEYAKQKGNTELGKLGGAPGTSVGTDGALTDADLERIFKH